MTNEVYYKHVLQTLVNDILESGFATEIDAGCSGFGPVSDGLVALGMTRDEANIKIWGSLDDIGSDEGETE